MTQLPHIPAETVHDLLPYAELADALEAAHRQPPAEVRRTVFSPQGSDAVYLGLPAWQPGQAIGVKLVTVFPANLDVGLPSVQAVYVLFDGTNGTPLATMDGTALTYRKTAADSALGSRLLSRADSRTLLMVGAGGLAAHLVAGHRAVRPSLDRVLVWNRTRARAEELAAAVGGELIDDLDEAVAEADIISTATMTTEPLIKGHLLTAGTHLDLVGAFLPDHREADDECIRRARIYVDSRQAAVEESGDLVIPLSSGLISHDDIVGDLFDLCQGRADARTSADDITLFENGGGGHLDLMTGQHVWSHYRRHGH